MKLEAKVAFISGVGGGIGGGIAEAFVEKGMSVVLADIDVEHAQTIAAQFGDKALAVKIDMTLLDSWAAARQEALSRFGQVDVLCNNARIS